MKIVRKIIHIDEELCDGCGLCVPACAEGAIEIVDGKARLVAEKYCDGLGACLGGCPKGALSIIERDAEEFDEEAVEEYLRSREETPQQDRETLTCGCPSSQVESFSPLTACQEANKPTSNAGVAESALTHWPVQIRLLPPTAPFLKGANLLIAADCTPIAYPNFHRDFINGRVVMVGCPKFDEVQAYIQRLADIFSINDIHSVTVVVMEVPCCQGLPMIVEKGMDAAGKKIPVEKVILSTRGEVLARQRLAT